MRKYDLVYEAYSGETKIMYHDDNDTGWTVFDVVNNVANAETVVRALNKNSMFE